MAQQKNDIPTQDEDLKDHGVSDIIPEDGEYYTIDLQRDFDGLQTDEEKDVDIAGDNPLDEDEMPEIVDIGEDENVVDEDNEGGVEVGEPGHWGVDEDTD